MTGKVFIERKSRRREEAYPKPGEESAGGRLCMHGRSPPAAVQPQQVPDEAGESALPQAAQTGLRLRKRLCVAAQVAGVADNVVESALSAAARKVCA